MIMDDEKSVGARKTQFVTTDQELNTRLSRCQNHRPRLPQLDNRSDGVCTSRTSPRSFPVILNEKGSFLGIILGLMEIIEF